MDQTTPAPMASVSAALERMTDDQFDQALDTLKATGRTGVLAAVRLMGGLAPIIFGVFGPPRPAPPAVPGEPS